MHLKTVQLLFAYMWLASACKPEYRYLIKADVQNCDGCQGELFFHNNSKTKTIETAYVKNGSFFMQGKITLPGFYEVKLSDTVTHTRVDAQIYLPADTVLLTFNPEGLTGKPYRFPAVHSNLAFARVVSTSPVQQTLNKYLTLRDSMEQKHLTDYDLRMAFFRQAVDAEDKTMVNQWADTVNNFPYRSSSYKARSADIILQQHPESKVAFFAMLDNINRRTAYRFRRFYQNLHPDRKESFYGRMLDHNLALYEGPHHNAQQFVGRSVPALFGVTPSGGKLDVPDIYSRNKFTLVQFWGSWCDSCHAQLPRLQDLYKRYHDQGFDVIAIAQEDNVNEWHKAIADYPFPAHHLSELHGEKSENIIRFRVRGIPSNLLIDRKGKIVAVDIALPELKSKLEESL